MNNAAGAIVVSYFVTGVESQATWKFRGNEDYRGTGTVAVADHGTKTVWVNPDKIETFSDNQMHNMFLHELGHTFGFINHTSCTQSVMYALNQGSITSLTCGDRETIQVLYFCDGCGSPIIIDVDCRNTRLTGPEVPFDIDGDGNAEIMAWTIPSERGGDGFLVFERNGTGAVESGRELFGNNTPLSWDMNGPIAAHGFQALEWFDRSENHGNGDGWIDRDDYIYSQLQLWLDDNHNGISEANELQYLEQHGILRISTGAEFHNRRDRWGNRFAYRGVVVIEDRNRLKACPTWDVFLVMEDDE
jgi:hypothetical protein